MLVDWVSPRAKNRVDIIEMFDKKDEHQIFERDPDWFHSFQENGTLFGHISFQGLKVLSRIKSFETVKVEIEEAEEPKRFCAIATVLNGNSQRAGAYSVPIEKEFVTNTMHQTDWRMLSSILHLPLPHDSNQRLRLMAKLIAGEMATRNAYRQLLSEADWTLFLSKDRVYFAHPIFKKDSEDAAIVKNAIHKKMPSFVILDPARILRNTDPPNVSFNLGFNCIRHSTSFVFITADTGFITKGVFREIQRAFLLKKDVIFCKLERFDSGLCKAELLPITSDKVVGLKRNNPNEFGKVNL